MNATNMNIEDIKAHLRKDYGRWPWQWPKKSDRCMISEHQWSQINWTKEEIERNIVLPHKMWNMRHDDWPINKKAWRGDDARGSRAPLGHYKNQVKVPVFIEGRGVARWMTPGDTSVVEVPAFADYGKLLTVATMPRLVVCIERNPGSPDFGRTRTFKLPDFLREYGPTALQKFSKRSYLKRFPHHVSYSYVITNREIVGVSKSLTGADTVAFWRSGARWDSLDKYFIENAFFAGLRWN